MTSLCPTINWSYSCWLTWQQITKEPHQTTTICNFTYSCLSKYSWAAVTRTYKTTDPIKLIMASIFCKDSQPKSTRIKFKALVVTSRYRRSSCTVAVRLINRPTGPPHIDVSRTTNTPHWTQELKLAWLVIWFMCQYMLATLNSSINRCCSGIKLLFCRRNLNQVGAERTNTKRNGWYPQVDHGGGGTHVETIPYHRPHCAANIVPAAWVSLYGSSEVQQQEGQKKELQAVVSWAV